MTDVNTYSRDFDGRTTRRDIHVKSFSDGQRVSVRSVDGEYSDPKPIEPQLGTVVRVRRSDNGAWVRLDKRIAECPFPADDDRANHVLVFPENCDPVAGRIR